jgi:hypothetical protein
MRVYVLNGLESLSDSESGKTCLARTQPATVDNRDPGSLLYNLPYTTSQADRSKTKQVRPVYYALTYQHTAETPTDNYPTPKNKQ